MRVVGNLSNVIGPPAPECLKKHIEQRTCCTFSQSELDGFTKAYLCLAEYTYKHPLSEGTFVIVVFTDEDVLSISQEKGTYGQSIPLATIWLKHMRSNGDYTEVFPLLVLLEELLHTLYQVQDERTVKEMMEEVVQPHLLHIRFRDLYPGIFDRI